MTDIDTWNWIVAQDSNGSEGIVSEAVSEQTATRFIANAQDRGQIVSYIPRSAGVHWDGYKCDTSEIRRIKAGIRRNRRG